uniref:Attacin_C domain-containing protein n=1 Tax=Echinostoma caproni TaxID=27848 RepID=A0A183B9R4_9TREM
LIASTLSTCLYLCVIGAPYSITSGQSEYSGTASQVTKAIHTQTHTRLAATVGTTAGYQYPENEKFATSQTLGRSIKPRGFLPSGDINDRRRTPQQSGEANAGQTKASLGPLQASNWSNSTQISCPRLGNRRRGHSADPLKLGLGYIPSLSSKLIMAPTNGLDADNGFQSPRRLWLPNLNNQNTTTLMQAPTTEYGTSHLIGQGLEPLGHMLYTGGRVRLGNHS